MEIQTKLQTKFSVAIDVVSKYITNLVSLLTNGLFGFIVLVTIAIALLQISVVISNLPFLDNQDATLIGISINTILNIILIAVTLSYVVLTGKILKQSKEQQEIEFTQQRNQQEFEFIQKRLELLYYPLKISMYRNYKKDLCGWSERYADNDTVSDDPTEEPWAVDSELDKILNSMMKDFEKYYKYSYLI